MNSLRQAIGLVRESSAEAIVQAGKAWAAIARHVLPKGHPVIVEMDKLVHDYEARQRERLNP